MTVLVLIYLTSLSLSFHSTVLLADARKSNRKSNENESVCNKFERGDYIAKVGIEKPVIARAA